MTERSPRVEAMRRNGQKVLLDTLAERYRQELGAEEDVFRTMPFFATALGVDVAACVYVANRLPGWAAVVQHRAAMAAVICLIGTLIFGLAVLVCLMRATWFFRYWRAGTEANLVRTFQAQLDYFGAEPDAHEDSVADGLRTSLIELYAEVIPQNRKVTQRRLQYRAIAASALVGSLMLALAATATIFMADKFGNLPRGVP